MSNKIVNLGNLDPKMLPEDKIALIFRFLGDAFDPSLCSIGSFPVIDSGENRFLKLCGNEAVIAKVQKILSSMSIMDDGEVRISDSEIKKEEARRFLGVVACALSGSESSLSYLQVPEDSKLKIRYSAYPIDLLRYFIENVKIEEQISASSNLVLVQEA